MGIAHWEWPEKFGYSPSRYAALVDGNRTIFERLLPDLVAEHDPARFYMPSSPIGFWNDEGDDARGDNHYWGVWHGELPFSSYAERVPRFMSEFGFQSYPIASSIARFAAPAERRVGSPTLLAHQKHARGDAIIGRFVQETYGQPVDFASFCYLSQLVQADGLRLAFEAHRSAMPRCMGSLYWQFNDCWPAISWSSIDYYGQWKALHYQAARSFAPLLITTRPVDGGVSIHVVSDLTHVVDAAMSFELLDFAGVRRWQAKADLSIAENSARMVHHIDQATVRAAGDLADLILHVALILGDGTCVARDIRVLEEPLHAHLPDPKLTVTLDNGRARVRTEQFARAVHLTADLRDEVSPTINFADNFFDLLPGEERVIALRDGLLGPDHQINVSSLWDACTRNDESWASSAVKFAASFI